MAIYLNSKINYRQLDNDIAIASGECCRENIILMANQETAREIMSVSGCNPSTRVTPAQYCNIGVVIETTLVFGEIKIFKEIEEKKNERT